MKNEWRDWYIVLDPLASSPDRFAAGELQAYLRKITGQLVKIVEVTEPYEPHLLRPLTRCIFTGPSRLLAKQHPDVSAVSLADEEVFLWRRGDALVLTGGGKRGVMYAVYFFLERFMGCRFFTEDDECVPAAAPELPDSFQFRSTPDFATRDMLSLYMRTGNWAAKLRLNGHFANVNALQGFKRGIYPFVHTFAHVVPPERWFKTHPEYFSLIKGERNPKQLCLSNPKVLELVTEQILRWIEDHPDYDIFSLSENDGGGFCECDRCWKMNGKEIRACYGRPTQPGAFFRFVNRVADAVAKPYPDKWIDTLSYGFVNRLPPKHFDMAPNVMVRVCMHVDGPKRLRLWLKAARRVGIWHYFTWRHFLLPFPLIMNSIPTVLKTYRQLGIKDVFLQTPEDEHGGVESMKLQVYAASKLFWNVRENPYPHVEEFIRHYYGPAAEEMQKVFDLTQSVLKAKGAQWDCWKWEMDTVPPLRRAMPELEKRTRPLFERSARSVRGTKYALRLAEAALPFRYFDLMREDRPPLFTANNACPLDVTPVRKSVGEMVRTLRALKVRYWHHDYTLDVLEQAIRPLELKRLKNRFLEVLILPGVGGRIVQVIDRLRRQELIPSGRNLYEFESSGYEEYAGHWHHEPGYREPYQVQDEGRQNGALWIQMRADLSNGFRLARRVTLCGHEVRIRSVLTNRSARTERGELRLHTRWRCAPQRDRVQFMRSSGGCEDSLLAGYKNRELEHLSGNRLVFLLKSLGIRLEHEFFSGRIEKVMLLCRDQESDGHFVSDVFMHPRRLAPGASLAIEQVYRLTPLFSAIPRPA